MSARPPTSSSLAGPSGLARFLPPSFFAPAAAGFAFWGMLVNYRLIPHGMIFLHLVFGVLAATLLGMLLARRFGASWHESAWPWAAAVGYVAVAVGVNCNVLFFYLLSAVYYPFPRPDHATLRVILFYTAPVAFAALYGIMGGRAYSRLARSERRRRDAAWGALGFGVGLFAGNATVAVNWVAGLFVGMALLALAARSRAGAAAALALVAVAFGLHLRQPDLIYVGSLQDEKLEAVADSPYTRSQFYTFADGRCVALASGFHTITYNCQDPNRLPRGLSYFFRALVGGLPAYRALVVGRTLGMYPNILLAANPRAELIQTAEYDPMQARLVEQRFDPLTLLPPGQGKMKYFAGDLSRFVLAQHEQYDVVFYNGIGLSQYPIPFSFAYHEQSLFTDKVLDHLFAEVLSPHGAIVFDWGGRTLQEQEVIRNALPAGVASAAFWYVLTDPPFTGTPLSFIIASRDAALIAGVRDHLARASYFKDITNAPGSQIVPSPIPWNRPFLRPMLAVLQLAGLALLFAAFAAGLYALRFRPSFLAPALARPQPWLAGVVAVGWFIDAAARHGRQLVGYGYAWPVMGLAFAAALAAGMFAPTRLCRRWSGKAALSLGAAAAVGVSALDLTGAPAVLSCALAGLVCGVGWGLAVEAGTRSALPGIFGGVATGFVLTQAANFLIGFDGGAALAGLSALVLIWTSGVNGRDLAGA